MTLGQILDRTVARCPDNEAVVYADRDFRLTYREFGERVDRLARGLMAMGVQKGEKVAVWATNVPDWVTLQFATAKIGAVLLTVNTSYRATELAYVLKQSDTENLFLIDGFRDIDYVQTVYELVPELRTQERGQLSAATFPHLKRVFFLGPEKHRGMYSIPEVLALAAMTDEADYRARQAALDPHDVINMQYTSGTTGFPKGVMLTHHNIVNNGFWIGERPELRPGRPGLPAGAALPLLRLRAGRAGRAHPRRDDRHPGELRPGAGAGGGPEGALHGALRRADHVHRRAGPPDVRHVRLSTACAPASWPARPARSRRCGRSSSEMHCSEITICYGLTEASPVITQTRSSDDIRRSAETVGRAMPGIEVQVVDPEDRRGLPAGRPGRAAAAAATTS